MNPRMPAFRRRRHWLPLSILAAATATATMATAVPATARPHTTASATTAASVKPGPSPLGKTKAPASTAFKVTGQAGQPVVESAAADPGFYAIGVGQVPWSEFYSAQLWMVSAPRSTTATATCC